MFMIGRYALKSKKAQSQAQIDAQREAARREAARRAHQRAESEVQPTFRGAALELQSIAGRQFEVMVSGPAETGKTYACCWLLDTILRSYPNVQAVLARKIRDTILPTVLQTYIKIINQRGGVSPYGGKSPEWFDYFNGSRLWLAGLDKPGNALSSERDIIYVNQAEDLALGDWETLTTRATGRAGNLPFSLMLGDCNPGPKTHWIVNRAALHVMRSYHKDNPTLFDDNGVITQQGEKSLSILSNLSEPRRSRLFLGLWASAEGQVYPTFDSSTHVIPSFKIPQSWPCFRVIDFGYNNPFVCAWFAYDRANDRLVQYREIYMTGHTVEAHARQIADIEGWEIASYDTRGNPVKFWRKPISERENIVATICDHDAEDRATLERYGIPNVPAFKAIRLGIEAVNARLHVNPDTKLPRLQYFNDALVEIDPELKNAYKPLQTIDEFEGYVWTGEKKNGKIADVPVDKDNHGMDTTRYACAFVDDIGAELEDQQETVTYEEQYQISPI